MTVITTVYPGASLEDVELNVTNRLEAALTGLGVRQVVSTSVENLSSILVTIDPNSRLPDDVRQAVREAVGSVSSLRAQDLH